MPYGLVGVGLRLRTTGFPYHGSMYVHSLLHITVKETVPFILAALTIIVGVGR